MTPPDNLKLPVPGMDLTLAADDGMFVREYGEPTAWEHYIESGRSALNGIRAALLAAEVATDDVRSILDLPCGHGRSLRVLKAAFPHAALTACDIDRSGADFCAKTFGAKPVYSVEDPAKIPIRDRFDLIWVGSLLTHLDAPLWHAFLKRFREWLSPRGVCVFTTHGIGCEYYIERGMSQYGLKDAKSLLADYRKHGFAYQPYEKGGRYGTSLSKAWWVAKQAERLPATRLVMLSERGWHDHQDLVAMGPTHA